MDEVEIPIEEINHLFSCSLCNSYFRNAHTINECMHTFCFDCISNHFEKETKSCVSCPTCGCELGHKRVAFSKLITDGTIQSIVDKLFPQISNYNGLHDSSHNIPSQLKGPPISSGQIIDLKVTKEEKPTLPSQYLDIEYKITLLQGPPSINDPSSLLPVLPKPSFRSKLDVKVSKIQQFVHKRLDDQVRDNLNIDDIQIYLEEHLLSTGDLAESYAKFNLLPSDPIKIYYRKLIRP